jgi:putative flippase GtrA
MRNAELWRYYYVGAINTAFGYGLYALLVFLGLNLFVAQILAHISGSTFNYFMFRRHVFRNQGHPFGRYILAYALNYLMGLTCLAVIHSFLKSPYLAGFGSLIITATINYFVLRRFVFKTRNVEVS